MVLHLRKNSQENISSETSWQLAVNNWQNAKGE